MINESINFINRTRPGTLGQGQPIIFKEDKEIESNLKDCTHIKCKYCGQIYLKKVWFASIECPGCRN